VFQSSPGPKTGSNALPHLAGSQVLSHVSILSRPEDREQLKCSSFLSTDFAFQSSPGPKTGSNAQISVPYTLVTSTFQSSPGPKTGSNIKETVSADFEDDVSILSRPEDREQLWMKNVHGTGDLFQSSPGPKTGSNDCTIRAARTGPAVSILSRPEDREQRGVAWQADGTATSFNPLPARRPGATTEALKTVFAKVFQSSPGPKTGSNPISPRW